MNPRTQKIFTICAVTTIAIVVANTVFMRTYTRPAPQQAVVAEQESEMEAETETEKETTAPMPGSRIPARDNEDTAETEPVPLQIELTTEKQ